MNSVLGDYFELQRGTTYKSAMLGQAGPVLLGLGSIARNGGFKGDNLKTYGGPCDPRHLLKPGEIYVSLKDVTQSADLLGAVARVPSNVPLGRLTQDTVKLVFKDEDAPRTYLYWLLQTPQYREYCRAHSTGTTNLGLARDDFLNFDVPPLTPERKWIVGLVQNIEDKIELNRRMNATLEAMAQAIFRDWFVDFGPVYRKMAGATDPVAILGGLIADPARATEISALFSDALADDGSPVGWEKVPVGELCSIKGGKQLTKDEFVDNGPIPVFGGAGHMGQTDKANAEGYVITVGRVGAYCGKFVAHRGKAWVNNNASEIRPSHDVPGEWLFLALNELDIELIKKGAAQPFISNGDLAKMGTVWPGGELTAAFMSVTGSIIHRSEACGTENRTLAETRDYLLPRLMSGKVRVAGAERMAG